MLAGPPRHHRIEIGAPDDPFEMRAWRIAARTAGDYLSLRFLPLRGRHTDQTTHQTAARLAATAPMPPALRLRTAAPESERVAIKSLRRPMRGFDLRPPRFIGAALEEVLFG